MVTGWYDAGIVEGNKNKLVPSVSLQLRNKSDEPVRSVQINAIFKRVNETEMWGEHFGWAVQREPLPPGGVTARSRAPFGSRLYRRTAAAADAAEQGVRGRESRNISEAGIEGLG